MAASINLISGVMIGIEFLYEEDVVVLDLGIIRLMIYYGQLG